MDETERMVLRRRKQYLSEVVDVTPELLCDLRDQAVISPDTVNIILLEKLNSVRMVRLIEAVVAQKPVDGFNKFCSVLSNSYKWLSRDLIADLRVEKGEIQPPPELIEEAAVLVHRKFGTSKRFSEGDKRDMAELIAIKLQIAQEEWQQDTSKLRDECEEATGELRKREALSLTVYNMQRNFVREREAQLVTHAHDMNTTNDVIKRCLRDPTNEVLELLKDNLERLFKTMALTLNQREALFYEKEKSLKMLGVKNIRVSLDDVISKMTGKTVNARMEVENKSDVIEKLEKKVEQLEKTVEKYINAEKEMKKQLGERDREISKLRHMVQI